MEVLVIDDDDVSCNRHRCEFCSLECPTSEEYNHHIVQHFKQKVCIDCGKTLIRVGDIWFGQHTAADCCASTEEIVLPDFIEVKPEEIVDVEEGIEEDIFDDDIFDDELIDDTEDVTIHSEDVRYSRHNSINRTDEHNRCPLCNKTFTNERRLIQHIEQHNGPNKQPYSLAELQIKEDSNDHEDETDSISLTEEQLSSRKCPLCGKLIVNKQNLICHMNIHRGLKPFVCAVCNKSFAHNRNLVRHKEQQRHCEMKFKCTMKGCKERFMSNNKLNRHIKLAHLPESSSDRPYPCDRCEKSFMTLGFLRMHLKRHDSSNGYMLRINTTHKLS